MSEEKLSIEELGEFGLISHLTEKFKDKREETIRSIGDDAAVIGKGKIKDCSFYRYAGRRCSL